MTNKILYDSSNIVMKYLILLLNPSYIIEKIVLKLNHSDNCNLLFSIVVFLII